MKSHQIKRVVCAPFRFPLLLLVALIFSGILYAVDIQASVYDIQNPKWVITMAILILISPLFSGVFILLIYGINTGKAILVRRALTQTLSSYMHLVVGEILVNLVVLAGSFLFVLPGIYLGLRLCFYKQVILIEGATAPAAIKESFRQTVGWRIPGSLLLLLAPFYALAILVGYVVISFPLGLFGEGLTLAASTLTFAWTNTLLTTFYMLNKELPPISPSEQLSTHKT